MSNHGETSKKDEILIAISISFGALFIATVGTLIIARYYKKLKACCLDCMPCLLRTDETEVRTIRGASFQDGKIPLMLTPRNKQEFVIPGKILEERIQPELSPGNNNEFESSSECQSKETEVSESSEKADKFVLAKKKLLRTTSTIEGPVSRNNINQSQIVSSLYKEKNPLGKRRSALHRSEPLLLNDDDTDSNNISGSGSIFNSRRFHSISAPYSPKTQRRIVFDSPPVSEDEEEHFHQPLERQTSASELRPELYDKSRKKSVGTGTLGKIRISLQFLDKDRSKLELFLSRVDKLELDYHGLSKISVGVMMLPDRDNMYWSKNHQATASPEFNEAFVFTRTHSSGMLQTKSLRFLIYLNQKHDHPEQYGESRMQLAGREIFSKVQTDVVLNVNPPSQLVEIGDMLIEIVYTEKDRLYAFVKTMKLVSSYSFENFSALQVKCFVKNKRRKLKPDSSVSIPIPEDQQSYIPINIEIEQSINENSIANCSLHVVLSGKHNFMGKKKLGKAIIGNNALDQSGILNWKNIMTSSDAPSILWHVIYAY